ncbi:prospero homeobox protein 1-like protein [Lates japonicus]|uniref:Prospero homeobox protein 1-like protein n=1 Tax=Lates japonicus TaxID=270547 RepID=A0AAD3MX93_LATJO|nr:prospero homeobox protein 1-like protein [Lates japonicus]
MPDHDSTTLLTRQTKRRRVDIGVKRTVGSAIFARARETLFDSMNQSHGPDQEGDCSLVSHGHGGTASDGEKSNVLRKLLKRANSYEDAIMPFPGATIISQLLKNNIGKNGGSDSGFQGSGALSSGGSEIQAEDACSNSSRDQDSPSDCLSPGPPLPPPSSSSSFGRPPPPSSLNSHAPSQSLTLSSFDLDRLSDEHLRAKRARVENIIRGMSHSPLVRPNAGDHNQESNRENENSSNNSNSSNDHRGDGNGHNTSNHNHMRSDCPSSLLSSPGSRAGVVSVGEVYRENKRKQRLPQQQHSFTQLVCSRQEQRQEERRQLKLQLEDMQKQLRQLQEKFYQIYDSETEEEEENCESGEVDRGGEREEDGNLSEDSIRSDGLEERHRDRGLHSHDELSDLDPGLFLDRARALLREQALLDGEIEEDVDGREEEERNGERVMKRRGRAAGGEEEEAVSRDTEADGALALTLNGDGSPNPNYHSSNQRLHCFGDVIVPSPLDSFGGLSPPSFRHTFPLPLMGYPSEPLGHTLRTKMASLGGGHLSHHHRQSSPSQHGPEGLSLSLIKSEGHARHC